MTVTQARRMAQFLIDAATQAEAAGKADIDLNAVANREYAEAHSELMAAIQRAEGTGT